MLPTLRPPFIHSTAAAAAAARMRGTYKTGAAAGVTAGRARGSAHRSDEGLGVGGEPDVVLHEIRLQRGLADVVQRGHVDGAQPRGEVPEVDVHLQQHTKMKQCWKNLSILYLSRGRGLGGAGGLRDEKEKRGEKREAMYSARALDAASDRRRRTCVLPSPFKKRGAKRGKWSGEREGGGGGTWRAV